MCVLIDQIISRVDASQVQEFRDWITFFNSKHINNIKVVLTNYKVSVIVVWEDRQQHMFSFSCKGQFTDITKREYDLESFT